MGFSELYNNQLVRPTVILFLASGFSQLLFVLTLPLLTRLYTPENFGVLALFSSFVGVASVICSLRYELAIPLPRNDKNAIILLSIAFYIAVFFVFVISIVTFVAGEQISNLFNAKELQSYLWLLPLAVMFAGMYKALNYMVLRCRQYRWSGIAKLTKSASVAIISLLAGWFGLGAMGLVLGLTVGGLVAVLTLFNVSHFKHSLHIPYRNSLKVIALIKRYKKFPIYDTPASGLNVLSSHLPNLLLVALFNPAVAGMYYMAERVLAVPMSLLGGAISQVFYSQSVGEIAQGTYQKKVYFVFSVLSVMVLPPALIAFIYAEPIFVFVFGDEWRQAGLFVSWLVFGLSVQFVYSPISMVLMATEGQKINLLLHGTMLIAKFSVLYLCFLFGSIEMAIKGLSAVLVCGYSLGIIIAISRAGRADSMQGTQID